MDIETDILQWPRTLFRDEEPRQPGIHLGDIIKYIVQTSESGSKRASFRDMQLTAELGLLWEDLLSLMMQNKYAFRPPQIQRDGIWMSPDGINDDPKGKVPLLVEEYKFTWKSTRNDIQDNFAYMTQAMSYCDAYDTNVALFQVFHCMGDYKGSGPLWLQHRITYTKRELKENWDMILRHKREYESVGE